MQVLGLFWGIASIVGMFIALVPFLGWFNWFVIPFAAVGLIISIIGTTSGKGRRGAGIAGIVLCSVAIFLGASRLSLGGGII